MSKNQLWDRLKSLAQRHYKIALALSAVAVLLQIAIKKAVGLMVLPAQWRHFDSRDHGPAPTGLEEHSDRELKRDYGLILRAVETIPIAEKTKAPEFRKMIICFSPQLMAASQRYKDYRLLALSTDSTVIAYDYRGVDRSDGGETNETRVVNDGLAIVQDLIKEGFNAGNITLFGTSKGGAVAIKTVAVCRKHHLNVRLINDRSFSSYADAFVGLYFSQASPRVQNFMRRLAHIVLWWTDWRLSVLKDWLSIPDEDKMLMVAEADNIIDYKLSSLCQAITKSSASKSASVVPVNTPFYPIVYLYESKAHKGIHCAPLEALVTQDKRPVIEVIKKFLNKQGA